MSRKRILIFAGAIVLVLTVPERMGFDWADFDSKYDPAARTVTWDLSDLDPVEAASP